MVSCSQALYLGAGKEHSDLILGLESHSPFGRQLTIQILSAPFIKTTASGKLLYFLFLSFLAGTQNLEVYVPQQLEMRLETP